MKENKNIKFKPYVGKLFVIRNNKFIEVTLK